MLYELKNKIKKCKLFIPILKKRRERIEKKLVKITHKYGYDINDRIYILLKDTFEFFTLCGTLLGVVRDNKFIEYDNDMDYGIIIKDENDWKILYKILTKNKFKFSHYFEHEGQINEMCFRYKGVHIDFFGVYTANNTARFSSFYIEPGINYLQNQGSTLVVEFEYMPGCIEKIINESTFLIPTCYHEILTANYGDNYMTPIRGVGTESSCGNRKFYADKISILKKEINWD